MLATLPLSATVAYPWRIESLDIHSKPRISEHSHDQSAETWLDEGQHALLLAGTPSFAAVALFNRSVPLQDVQRETL